MKADPVSDAELASWAELCEKATAGPWRPSGQRGYVLPSNFEPYKVAQLGGTLEQPGQIARTDERLWWDTELICTARSALPRLIEEVRRIRSSCETRD